MFATAPESGGVIYYKTTDINNIQFPLGLGNPFIKSSTDVRINNATSTKQNLNSLTGLVILASDSTTHFYLHNYLSLNAGSPTPTSTPTTGPSPTSRDHTPAMPAATGPTFLPTAARWMKPLYQHSDATAAP
jgi:hypothetical protein